MTDAERSELEMLEGRAMRRPLTEFEEERLCALRDRERQSRRFGEFSNTLEAARPNPRAITDAIALLERMQRNEWVPYRDVRPTMLPPPAEDDGELE